MSEYDSPIDPSVEELMQQLSDRLTWHCRMGVVKRAAHFMVAGLAMCGDMAMGGQITAARYAKAEEQRPPSFDE